ncbi:MAG: PHP domain-containing protein [Candidatus Eremiobacteraeota bacterium]|nr:PHP domain-containing protein [Candidatus Eremiobacteraeota bacterium]
MIVDFHSHTSNSDGSLSTSELVTAMERRGVSIFSITDHDTTRAYGELPAMQAQIVTGIEINTSDDGRDVHILGFGFDPGPDTPLAGTMRNNQAARRVRVEKMLAQLQRAGYPVTNEMVAAEAVGSESLGRPHVAKALVRAGLVRDVETVFRQLLTRGCVGYVPSHHITPPEAIEAIARSGGVAVLAHPGRLREDAIIDALAEQGLIGLEVFYPTHTSSQTAYFREKAARCGLVMTAGSDFHDARWNASVVGIDVDPDDIRDFLELVAT